jgi:putative acyl-CoA dehydrogenase
VNSVWEGSGSVNALDLLRAITREAGTLDALIAELGKALGLDRDYDNAFSSLVDELADRDHLENRARRLAEDIALTLQGSLLLRYGPTEVAEAFCRTRLGGDHGSTFGTLPRGIDLTAIIDRATPRVG